MFGAAIILIGIGFLLACGRTCDNIDHDIAKYKDSEAKRKNSAAKGVLYACLCVFLLIVFAELMTP